MEIKSQVTKSKIIRFLIFNIILIVILYNIPIENAKNLCIFKMISGKECWNCGMTRAFLSILHFRFRDAISYNYKVIVVFPLTLSLYIYSWIKYIKRGEIK